MSAVHAFELILVLLAVALGLAVLARWLQVPTAVVFVLGGMALAVAPGAPEIRLDPELTMTLFLPPLLMASAYFTSWRAFRANLRPILLLAVGAVAFTTVTVAVVAKALLPGLPWAACFALGAIVSPPDAVAAASVLERLRMPRRIVTVLSGESLVNDASGLVLYRFAVAAAMTGVFDPVVATGAFLAVSAGGIGVGLVAGWGLAWLAPRLRDTHLETAASFLAAWGSYILAEQLHVSGVLATVVCGVWFGWRRHEVLSARTRLEARAAWGFVVFVMDALVFILIGLSLHGVLQRIGPGQAEVLAPAALAVVATVIVGRFVWVFPAAQLSRPPWVRKRDPVPPAAVLTVISWAGMRGVVSLAAALALPAGFPGRDAVIVLTFAVILGTVLLQGVTLGPLIRRLGLGDGEGEGEHPAVQARLAAERAALAAIEHRAADPLDGAMAADLLAEYRDRAGTTVGDAGPTLAARRAAREARLVLRLHANEAARVHLVAQSRAGELDDDALAVVVEELDLEDLRLRHQLGQAAH
jgi:CPA1 family monovalent cation:H+ antiporter